MDVKYLDWVIESSQFIIVSALFIFHIYRSSAVAKNKREAAVESDLCGFIQLRHVSYLVLFVYFLKALFNLSKSAIDGTTDIDYNHNRCVLFQKIDATLGIIARLFIHLFVAMRSRFGSTIPTIWHKIGLMLILSDIGLILMPWMIHHSVNAIYANNICVVISYNKILLCWVLFSDFFIGIYCLFVFVLPLKAVLKWERKTVSPTTTATPTRTSVASFSPSTQTQTHRHRYSHSREIKEIRRVRSLTETVHKIVLFSSIMIISSLVIISIAFVLSLSHFDNAIVLSLLPPIDNILNSWCIILQFADISSDALFGRTIISFFQCNYCTMQCWCCLCKSTANQDNDNNDINPNNNVNNANNHRLSIPVPVCEWPGTPTMTSYKHKPSFASTLSHINLSMTVLHQTKMDRKPSVSNGPGIADKTDYNNKAITDSKAVVVVEEDNGMDDNKFNSHILLALTPAPSMNGHEYLD